MDYQHRLAALAATDLGRCFRAEQYSLLFVRSRSAALSRAVASGLATVLLAAWAWSLEQVSPTNLETVCALAAAGLTAVLARRALRGDVLVVLDRAGLRVRGRFVPWPAIRATQITDDGSLHIDLDDTVDVGGDLHLKFASADISALQSVIEAVAFEPLEPAF